MNHRLYPTPEVLMARFKAELDEAAFELLVEHYASPAAALANQILRDRALAEDAVQEAFVRVINKRNRYVARRPFSRWFYAILRHVCIDMLRKRKRDQQLVKELCNGIKDSACDGAPADFTSLLGVLPPNERSALELRVVHSMTFREVAAALGISEEAAKKRAQRGLRRLRQRFERAELIQRRAV